MTSSARWFVDVMDQVFAGIGAKTNPVFQQFLEETDGLEGADIALAQMAYGFDPEPITPPLLIKRTPYANPDTLKQQVKDAAGRGWLEAQGQAQYRLTTKGKEVVDRLWALGDKAFGEIKPLPEADMKRLLGFLAKVVRHAHSLTTPADKENLLTSRKFDRGSAVPFMVQVRRYLLDILAYRDDAHVAAWEPYGVSGQAWEAFTFVWRGDASTAAELVEKLPYRYYDEGSYVAALADLASRGWVTEGDGKYAATGKGAKLRQEAEDTTDRYFDAGWTVLTPAETKEARELLARFAEALKPTE